MKSRVRALRRKMALAYAQVALVTLADDFCHEWHVALANNRPLPDSPAFVRRVTAAGLYLPNFATVVRFLERCRREETAPEPHDLLKVLLPWPRLPSLRFSDTPLPQSYFRGYCHLAENCSCHDVADAIVCNRQELQQ